MSILTKEVIQKILNDDWLLMDDCEGLENCTVIKELARMALAAMDSEPVAVPDHLTYLQNPTLENVLSDAEENSPMSHAARILAREVKFWRSAPLYRHAQPAPVVPDAIPVSRDIDAGYLSGWNACRAAMLQAGTFIGEGAEMPSLKCLEDVKFNADCAISDPESIYASEFFTSLDEVFGEKGNYKEPVQAKAVSMLIGEVLRLHNYHPGNYPVIPDGWQLVPREPTAAMNKAGWDAMNEYDAINPTYRAMLAAAPAGIPMNSTKWIPVSERMPETDGNYWGWWSESKRQGPVWFIKSELQAQFQSHEITHWMPLPAAPQEVQGE